MHAFDVPAGTKRGVLRLARGTAKECCLNTACINAIAFDGEHTSTVVISSSMSSGGAILDPVALRVVWGCGSGFVAVGVYYCFHTPLPTLPPPLLPAGEHTKSTPSEWGGYSSTIPDEP